LDNNTFFQKGVCTKKNGAWHHIRSLDMNNIEVKKRRRVAAVLAFILPFIPVSGATAFFMSCSNPTGGDTTTPVTTVDKTVMLGDFPITIEYQSNVSVSQAGLDMIQNKLTALSVNTTNPAYVTLVANIKSRGNLKIIIEDVSPYASGDDYRIIDGHTFAIRSAWLSEADLSDVGGMLLDSFTGILAEPVSKLQGLDNVKLAKQLDNAKETTVRLSMGKMSNSRIA